MIQDVRRFVPLGSPEDPVPRISSRDLASVLGALRPTPASDDGLSEVLSGSFRVTLLDALTRRPAPALHDHLTADRSTAVPVAPPPSPAARRVSIAPESPSATASVPPVAPPPSPSPLRAAASTTADKVEEPLIRAAARRQGIDARFLHALRRAENGRPGREFGVLSVPAPTYEDQARVAAESIRRNVERFEAMGRQAVDPVSGRYSEEFIRFFSNRYAPVGASNDPTGLNRYHARNLSRLYATLSTREG